MPPSPLRPPIADDHGLIVRVNRSGRLIVERAEPAQPRLLTAELAGRVRQRGLAILRAEPGRWTEATLRRCLASEFALEPSDLVCEMIAIVSEHAREPGLGEWLLAERVAARRVVRKRRCGPGPRKRERGDRDAFRSR